MTTDHLARTSGAVERACAEAANVVDLCQRVQRALAPAVPVDRWCGFAVDPAALMATNGYHNEGIDQHLFPRLLELEYGADDANQLPALARTPTGVATLTEATGGDPASSARWQDVIVPSGLAHELRAVFRDSRHVWGAFILLRGPDVADFTAEDVDVVAKMAPAIARGFRRVLVRQHLAYADDAREAGILVLSGVALEVLTATNAARAWLGELDDGSPVGALPTPVVSAARAARAGRAVATVRALTRGGRWLTITAEVTDTAGRGAPDVGVVVQPSRPAEIAQIVGAAHGLTPRETDVVLLVASGHTNQEIARKLDVSPYTVADHLKSTFGKLEVASRGEMTSKLFFDHYLGRVAAGRPVGVDSWFLPD